MFPNTPTIVPVTPIMSSNVPGVDSRRSHDVPNDSSLPPIAPNKVRPFETPVQVATAVHMATYNISDLGDAPTTPVNVQGALTTPVHPNAPQKVAPFQSRIPVRSKATASHVAKNVLRAPTPVTPTKVSARKVSPVVPTTPARCLPYRVPATCAPRRGCPVPVVAIEAKVVVPNRASVVNTPASISPVKSLHAVPSLGSSRWSRSVGNHLRRAAQFRPSFRT